jgi:asparagine synthase (glutamine-hydrolysing)
MLFIRRRRNSPMTSKHRAMEKFSFIFTMIEAHNSCVNNCMASLLSSCLIRKNGEYSSDEIHSAYDLRFVFTRTVAFSLSRRKPKVNTIACSLSQSLAIVARSGLKGVSVASKQALRVEPLEPGTFEEYRLDDNQRVEFIRKQRFHTIGTFPKYDLNIDLTGQLSSNVNDRVFSSSIDDVSGNIRSYLVNAVQMRLMSHRRVGCMLSGGLDSSLIAALTVQEARKRGITYPIQTFAIGMDINSPDLIAARKVRANNEHKMNLCMFSYR